MANYLVVANQTALSEQLARYVNYLVSQDAEARFTILVPATLPEHFVTWTPDAAEEAAWRVARAASSAFEASGAQVVRLAVGDPDALLAIENELAERPGAYDALVICTLPLGVSRWMRLDLPQRAEAASGLRVITVTGDATRLPLASPVKKELTALPPQESADILPTITEFLARALAGAARLPPERARDALVAIGRPSVPALLMALADPSDEVRWEAAKALGELHPPEAAVALVAALKDPHGGVRWLAADALASIGEPAVQPLLQALLGHSDSPWLRDGAHHVLRTLLRTGGALHLAPVQRALEGAWPTIAVMTAASDALKAAAAAPAH